MNLQLSDVRETALIPLAVRANETKRKNARIHDEKAVEITDALKINTKDYDKFFSHEGVVARTVMFDSEIKKIIRNFPYSVCVNMGCGLDNRFERTDNGKIIWFDADLPESIDVRRKVYEETERRKMLACDVTKTEWLGNVKAITGGRPVIFIAEGLFMYFSKEQTRTVLNNLTGSFERGYLLAELMHPKMANEKIHDTVKNTDAKFGWGTRSGKELTELDGNLTLIKETSLWDEMKKYTFAGKIGSVIARNLNNRIAVFKWKTAGKQELM